MCGIVGALAFDKLSKKKERDRQRIMRYFTTELLLITESRGKDATGAAVLFEDGNYVGMKRGDKASEFLAKLGESKERYGGFLKVWSEHDSPARIYLGHTRNLTIGPKDDNANNHPIKIGNIIGIHNGTIKNDDHIIKNLGCKRDGKVDSESIFRLFEHFTNKGQEPFTMEMVQKVVDRLDGQHAVVLFNADNPYQVPAFRDGKPIELIFIKEHKLLFMVSETGFWSNVLFEYERSIAYHGSKMPSLLDCTIEKETLIDDSCEIFDLTTKINEDTTIRDLGEWCKMNRTNKIWTTQTRGVSSYNNYQQVHGVAGYQGVGAAAKKDDDKDKVKAKRVFNKIEKRYVASGVEKELEDNESALLPVDGSITDNITDVKEDIETTDKKGQDKTKASTEIKDLTIYDNKKADQDKTNDKSGGVEKDEGNVIEVDMETDPPEFIAAAEEEYKATSLKEKGYTSIEDILDTVEKKDEKELEKLNKLMFANRISKNSWKKGFIASCKRMSRESEDEKNKKREGYITNLKSLVLLLISFFEHARSSFGNNHHENIINKKMETIALEYIAKTNKPPDMSVLRGIFNNYEKTKLVEIDGIITKAIKEDGEGNK